MKRTYDRVIFFSNGSIGDFLMALFLLENVHEKTAAPAVIIVPRMKRFLSDLAASYPFVSVREVNKRTILSHGVFFIRALLVRSLVFTHHSYTKIPFLVKVLARWCALRGGSMLAGFRDEESTALYDQTLDFDHRAPYPENMLALFRKTGLSEPARTTPVLRYESRPTVLSAFGVSPGAYVVFHPCAASAGTLPVERYPELVDHICEFDPGPRVLITGAPQDQKVVEGVCARVRHPARVKAVIGADAQELATLIDQSRLYVGVDTGVTHIACFLHKPAVVIGHRASPSWLPTYNENAVILYNDESCTCPGYKHTDCTVEHNDRTYLRCMYEISQEEIKRSISRMMT